MFNPSIPFFLKKSVLPDNSPEFKFLNAFGLKNDYESLSSKKNKFQNFSDLGFSPNPKLYCPSCQVFYCSHFRSQGSDLEWTCPSCEQKIELPDLKYSKLEGNVWFTKPKDPSSWDDKLLIVICLDYSQSMETSYFPSSLTSDLKEAINSGITLDEVEEIYMKSRKNIVIDSLQSFLERIFIHKQKFDIRIFIITFNNEVQLHGDCSQKPVLLDEFELYNLEAAFKKGASNAEMLCPKKFDAKSKIQILTSLRKFEAKSTTALGPAIAAGLGVVDRFYEDGFHNNCFIICTDGKSNKGIGDLDVLNSTGAVIEPQVLEKSKKEYEKMNEKALKLYLPFILVTFEDEVSLIKVFKDKLMKRLNGDMYQIKAHKNHLKQRQYSFCDDKEFEKHICDLADKIFLGKLVKVTVLKTPSCSLKFFKKDDVNYEHKQIVGTENHALIKKKCYEKGETNLGVFCEFTSQGEQSNGLFIQIRVEFDCLTEEYTEVFISSSPLFFLGENELDTFEKYPQNFLNSEVINFLIKKDGKKKMDENEIKKKFQELLNFTEKYFIIFRGKLTEAKKKMTLSENEKKEGEDDEEEKNDEPRKRDNNDDDDDDDDDSDDDGDVWNDKKTTHFFWEEKKDGRFGDK